MVIRSVMLSLEMSLYNELIKGVYCWQRQLYWLNVCCRFCFSYN